MRCIFNYFFFKFSLARKITLHFFIFILFRMKIIKMHFDVVFGLYSGTRSRAVGSAPAFTGNYFSYDVCSLRLQQYSLALRRPMRYISTPWDITGRRRWKAKTVLGEVERTVSYRRCLDKMSPDKMPADKIPLEKSATRTKCHKRVSVKDLAHAVGRLGSGMRVSASFQLR